MAGVTVKRKRILNLHWGFSLGGIAKYAEYIDQVNEYAPVEMHNVCIAREGKHLDEDALNRLRARIIRVRNIRDFSWIGKMREVINEVKPDYLMAHAFNGYALAYLTRKLVDSRLPLLASYHGGYHPPTRAKKIVEPLYNGFADHVLRYHASAIVTVANYCARELIQRNIDGDKITAVHNGIPDISAESGDRERIRREWGIDDQSPVIMAASQLIPYKGIDFLIDGFSRVVASHPDARLVILGMGVYEQSLRDRVANLDLQDRVLFGGMRNDILNCLAAADIFALPSLFEYHSIALLEAMRAGKAIISTDVGGNTESVRHEREGLIVPSKDSRAITDALLRLLNDPELAGRLASNARSRFVQEFTDDHMIRRTADWISRVTA